MTSSPTSSSSSSFASTILYSPDGVEATSKFTSCSVSFSSTTNSSLSCKWDVFLSFRGEDTRKTFVDHLYEALVDRNVSTYKDDETLRPGASINSSLFQAIEESRIAVIIFSKNYADSSWCLDELAYIMGCKDESELTVMPIFYDVEPSEVRKQKGDFGKGFAKQEANNIDKAETWRKALVEAGGISGWETKNVANGHESKAIKKIVDTIYEKLFSIILPCDEFTRTVAPPKLSNVFDDDMVGMNARVQELKAQLKIGSDDVRMVGVLGIRGSGKTSLAKSLYVKNFQHFQAFCFFSKIREISEEHGLKTLQENFLSSLLGREIKVHSVEEGKRMLKSGLKNINILIVLDDVDDWSQLDALVGSHNWLGSGSRVIITTRDEKILRTHNVDYVHPVELLSDDEAMTLFRKHAYRGNNPTKTQVKLSKHMVSLCKGNPLVLHILSLVLATNDESYWFRIFNNNKHEMEMSFAEKVKISYLDIKAGFKGEVSELSEMLGKI